MIKVHKNWYIKNNLEGAAARKTGGTGVGFRQFALEGATQL